MAQAVFEGHAVEIGGAVLTTRVREDILGVDIGVGMEFMLEIRRRLL